MRLIFLAALALTGGLLGWWGGLKVIPYIATDQLFAQFRDLGREANVLTEPRLRFAERNLVPMDNADTLTRGAMIDLSQGPLVFTATIPELRFEYWSVSVFAHNTDTVLIHSDRDLPQRSIRLLIRTPDQPAVGVYDAEAVLPSEAGYLIVRAIARDRNDPLIVDSMVEALGEHSLTRAQLSEVDGG